MKTEPETRSPEETVIRRILGEWRSAGISCLALRGYERLPQQVGNDLDVLVAQDDCRKIERLLLGVTSEHDLRRFMRVERSAGYLVSHRFYDRISSWNLAVDIWTGLTWKGIPFLATEAVLARRTRADLIDIPRPAHEAAASLFGKALHGSWVQEDRRERIRELVQSDEAEFRRVGELAFGARRTEALLERVRRLELAPDSDETRRLRVALVARAGSRRPLSVVTGLVRELPRMFERARRPTGVFIVLLGPDGSGKSSIGGPLTDRLTDRLGSDGALHFHWKPFRAFAPRDPGPVSSPHARPVRSGIASRAYLLLHWFEFLLGSWLTIQPRLIRGIPVIGERYFLDVWLDPIRYRLDLGSWTGVPSLLGVRKPDIVLCLVATPETLQRRKTEVPLAATTQQLNALKTFAGADSSARVIDVDRRFEDVLASCESAVLQCLAQRDSVRDARTRRRSS